MMERGRMRAWICAAVGLGVVGVGFAGFKTLGKKSVAVSKNSVPASVVTEASTLPELARAVTQSNGMALAILKNRIETKPDSEKPTPFTEVDAEQWTAVVKGLGVGYAKFSGYGRASAVVVVSEVLKRFEVNPAPMNWRDVIQPSSMVLGEALADQVWEVRVAAISEIKDLWTWSPSCSFMPSDVEIVDNWKQAFHSLVVQRLADHHVKVRTSAVACLGAIPLNPKSEAAVRLLEDPDPGVRAQVLISFADRPGLLSEEAILPLLHDPVALIPPVAKRVLKARGLTDDQIALGNLITHPPADMRVSALPFLKDRTDIDPVIWLVFLTRDEEESVRSRALEALAERSTPEARKRLAEMAATDTSPSIRKKAGKLLTGPDSTAELPQLPPPTGSLKLKAN